MLGNQFQSNQCAQYGKQCAVRVDNVKFDRLEAMFTVYLRVCFHYKLSIFYVRISYNRVV